MSFEELNLLSKTELESEEVKRAFLFSCVTGLRWYDIKELRWSNIKNDHLGIIKAKTGKPAHINQNETATKLLGRQGVNENFVFALPSFTAANDWLKQWVEKAGIDKKTT